MNLFDQLVTQALKNRGQLAPLRTVVEKELLHHDILREMSSAGLLSGLTFIGGTCLRACYGSSRLSEDLDFTGGHDFTRDTLSELADILITRLQTKYGLHVEVSELIRETGNVDTWKLKVITCPNQTHLPTQRIHIDIYAIPSYDHQPMMLRNPYGIEMGTSGLIIQAQSREEIFADKVVALALRPNRLKNRDLWDMVWLKQQGIALPLDLIPEKIRDHHCSPETFLDLLNDRRSQLQNDPALREHFINEIRRFLPKALVDETVEKESFWRYLTSEISRECESVIRFLKEDTKPSLFRM
ncbi:MAG: nucleotidyl transferase AbiEii/AbiGii toxin family protein [Desulfobacterales bacterium]|nr:nucleotidyl transferase AbiEii/AbiGii toxin family protein [Desulfobacterales bacterium]MDD4073632.1 nucleotidyl transferase AbiEii/AbiGii toxin family protein [Desulfobacterales bacterium]MDD4392718.1 nucleotidyl transferase AbiEii/AbiGii toxin family protein [Desulfobacterales bacterium]